MPHIPVPWDMGHERRLRAAQKRRARTSLPASGSVSRGYEGAVSVGAGGQAKPTVQQHVGRLYLDLGVWPESRSAASRGKLRLSGVSKHSGTRIAPTDWNHSRAFLRVSDLILAMSEFPSLTGVVVHSVHVLYLNVLRGNPEAESLGMFLSLLVSAVLGVTLGAGADSKHAIGVGWRIGLAWFLLSGLIEYPIYPQWSSRYTTDHFVGIFIGHALVVGLAFRLRKPIISANASGRWTIRDWMVLVGTYCSHPRRDGSSTRAEVLRRVYARR